MPIRSFHSRRKVLEGPSRQGGDPYLRGLHQKNSNILGEAFKRRENF